MKETNYFLKLTKKRSNWFLIRSDNTYSFSSKSIEHLASAKTVFMINYEHEINELIKMGCILLGDFEGAVTIDKLKLHFPEEFL